MTAASVHAVCVLGAAVRAAVLAGTPAPCVLQAHLPWRVLGAAALAPRPSMEGLYFRPHAAHPHSLQDP